MLKKKIVSIVLSVVLLISSLSACGSKPAEDRSFGDKKARKPLHVWVDVSVGHAEGDFMKTYFTKLAADIKNNCGIEELVFEVVPSEGSDREAAFQRLRTEIMAGTGPDLFLTSTVYNPSAQDIRDTLFTFPEKNMEAGLFLPLDDYMENNTRFTDWDKQTQAVLNAGRSSEGQVIIPLTYTFDVLVYPESKANIPFTTDLTMQEILDDPENCDLSALLYSYVDRYDEKSTDTFGINLRHFTTVLGELADYETEELCFTEQELHDAATTAFDLYDTAYAQTDQLFIKNSIGEDLFYALHTAYFEEEMALVPVYSRNGGVTASITAFAAVNRNTKYSEEAFTVLDYLMREDFQRNSEMFSLYFTDGIPMQNDLAQEGKDIYAFGRSDGGFVLPQKQAEDLLAIKEQITAVNFNTELDIALKELMYISIFENNSQVSPEAVSDCFDKMERMLGE